VPLLAILWTVALSLANTCSGLRLSANGPEIISILGPDYLRL